MITELKNVHPAIMTEGEDGGHYYSGDWDGEYVHMVPSVTTRLGILNKELEDWVASIAANYVYDNINRMTKAELMRNARVEWREVSQDHANVGTAVHELLWIDGIEYHDIPEDRVANCMAAWQDLQTYVNFTLIQDEQEFLGKNEHGYYGGTIDAVVLFDGLPELQLLEFKTSRMLYPAHAIQTAAYAKMLGLEQARCVRLDKYTKRWEIRRVRIDFAYEIFKHIHAVSSLMNEDVWYWEDRS